MNIKRFVAVLVGLAGFFANTSFSEVQIVRPGLDRPIRVGMFSGTGTGGSSYWSTNTHTAHTVMQSILARPDTAGLGDSLIIPPAGFTFYRTTLAWNSSTGAECTGNGCGPDVNQVAAFVRALDTLDVLIMNNVVSWSSRVTDSSQRAAFQAFWLTKGYVAIQKMADMRTNIWAPLDSIHGARLRGWPAEQTYTVRRDSAFMTDPAWHYLNKGVFSNGLDTSFFERPIYFTEPGATIRARSHLKPTVNVVPASILYPGSQVPMEDHPYSWYRQLPEGGRFFYTALGHRSQVWQNTRMFRRQLYNAILWAAGADSNGVVSVQGTASKNVSKFSGPARIVNHGGALTVSILHDGAHIVEVLGVDGRRVAVRRGAARSDHSFTNLNSGLHIVTVTTPQGRLSRRIIVP